MQTWVEPSLYAAGWLVLTVLLSVLARRLEARTHPLHGTIRALRGLLLPVLLLYLLARWLEWSTVEGREHWPDGLRVHRNKKYGETVLWYLRGVSD